MADYYDEKTLDSPMRPFRDIRAGMDFSEALRAMKTGRKVYRDGWVDLKWVALLSGIWMDPRLTSAPVKELIGPDTSVDCRPYFVAFTQVCQWQAGWQPTAADMLASDWMLYG